MHPTLACFALLAAAPLAGAQTLDVQQATRAVAGETHGFDYEYDDGLSGSEGNSALSGAWNADVVLGQVDYWGYDVAAADAVQQSAIDASAITFDLETQASTAGNHFSADARASAGHHVRFVLAERVWFEAAFSVDASVGYQTANASLSVYQSATIASASADQGGTDVAVTSGWLDPGEYVVRGAAECFAYGTSGQSDAQHASATVSLKVFHELDATRDGVVDPVDRRRFRRAWHAGHPSADFDDDGDIDLSDWISYTAAFYTYWV